jgi:DNA modification methylase
MGWPNPIPFAWVKLSAGIIPRPGRDLRQSWEPLFICERGGDRKVVGRCNWYAGDPPRGTEREHQSPKNEAMMQYLLSAFVTEDTRLLDPTCGSGVAIRVAKRLKAAYALGLEISDQSSLLARAALKKVKRGELLEVKENSTPEDPS